MTFQHIVVGSTLTEGSDAVLEVARDLADRLGASITVVHALTHGTLTDLRADLPAESSFDDTIVTRLETELGDLVKRTFDSTTAIDSRVIIGETAEVIRQVVEEEDADILVIGVRSRSRVGKLLLGSTAQDLLLSSPCPVLGVPL